MISAWDIYWVMQLDSIGTILFMFAVLGIIGGGLLQITRLVAASDENDAGAATFVRLTRATPYFLMAAIAAAIANGFLPSTKTAAMMVVVPRIANNEAIQREAGDLYGIAKDALRELAKPKQEAAK